MLKRISLVWSIVKNFFHRNLCCYWHISFSFDSSYNARGVNYAEKSLTKFALAGPVFLNPLAWCSSISYGVWSSLTAPPWRSLPKWKTRIFDQVDVFVNEKRTSLLLKSVHYKEKVLAFKQSQINLIKNGKVIKNPAWDKVIMVPCRLVENHFTDWHLVDTHRA
jgi:hypothetical protein